MKYRRYKARTLELDKNYAFKILEKNMDGSCLPRTWVWIDQELVHLCPGVMASVWYSPWDTLIIWISHWYLTKLLLVSWGKPDRNYMLILLYCKATLTEPCKYKSISLPRSPLHPMKLGSVFSEPLAQPISSCGLCCFLFDHLGSIFWLHLPRSFLHTVTIIEQVRFPWCAIHFTRLCLSHCFIGYLPSLIVGMKEI